MWPWIVNKYTGAKYFRFLSISMVQKQMCELSHTARINCTSTTSHMCPGLQRFIPNIQKKSTHENNVLSLLTCCSGYEWLFKKQLRDRQLSFLNLWLTNQNWNMQLVVLTFVVLLVVSIHFLFRPFLTTNHFLMSVDVPQTEEFYCKAVIASWKLDNVHIKIEKKRYLSILFDFYGTILTGQLI